MAHTRTATLLVLISAALAAAGCGSSANSSSGSSSSGASPTGTANVAYASSLDKDLKKTLKSHKSVDAAKKVGEAVAQRALKAGVKQVMFDRGQYVYHGRVKALADAARAGGLEF